MKNNKATGCDGISGEAWQRNKDIKIYRNCNFV